MCVNNIKLYLRNYDANIKHNLSLQRIICVYFKQIKKSRLYLEDDSFLFKLEIPVFIEHEQVCGSTGTFRNFFI